MYSRFSNSLKIVNSKSQCIQRYGKCLNIWPQLQSIIWWSVDVCCWGNFGNIPVFVACYSVKEMYTAPFPSANVFWTIVGSGDGRLFFILVSTQLERYRFWRGYVTKLWPKIMAVGRWFEITVAKKGYTPNTSKYSKSNKEYTCSKSVSFCSHGSFTNIGTYIGATKLPVLPSTSEAKVPRNIRWANMKKSFT
jgi:hypothetical protein